MEPQKKQKTCYYELLKVDRKATQEEIKTSYKKLALKYHPDRNRDNPNAKEIFQEFNQAYQTLSDPNDRSWYDNNRERILRNTDGMTQEDLENEAFGFNIFQFMESSCYEGFEDDEKGYFTVYRNVFEKIKYEEEVAFQYREDIDDNNAFYVKPPGFGDSNMGREQVEEFYMKWENFTTYKTFKFADTYDIREGHNRWEKRQIEKENKKDRKKEKKEYLTTIKKLVEMVKRKDPRWKQIQLEEQQKQEQREKERKKQEQLKAKIKKENLERARQEEQLRWQQLDEERSKAEQDQVVLDQEHQQEIEFYCEICQKEFRSENQLNNHQSSKLHKNNLKALLEEVSTPEERRLLEEFVSTQSTQPKSKFQVQPEEEEEEEEQEIQQQVPQKTKKQKKLEKKLREQSKQFNQNNVHQEQQQPTTTGLTKKQRKKKNKKNAQLSQQQEDLEDEQENKIKPEQKQPQKQERKKSSFEEEQEDSDSDIDFAQFGQSVMNKNKQSKFEVHQEDSEEEEEEEEEQQEEQKQKQREKEEKPQTTQKNSQQQQKEQQQQEGSEESEEEEEEPQQLSKAKLKKKEQQEREKQQNLKNKKANSKLKQQQQAQRQESGDMICKVCKAEFSSRTKLFAHIEEKGHAAIKK